MKPDDKLAMEMIEGDKLTRAAKGYESEIRAKYGMVFKEGIAREVLGDILHSCRFPGTSGSIYESLDPNDAAMIGRFNVGLEIAEKAGVLKAIGIHILGLNPKET